MTSSIEKARKHLPRHILSSDMHGKIHGNHRVGKFNGWLAVTITQNVGTMWAAYVFTIIGVTALVGALTGNLVLTLVVGGFSSYFLQLVLLPVIMVGQNVSQAASDARAEADHQTLTALSVLNKTQLEILEEIRKK
jgi:hypothetical protein